MVNNDRHFQKKTPKGNARKTGSNKPSEKWEGRFLPLILVFCIPVLLYVQTLKFGFTNFDDDLVIKNNISFLGDFHNAPKAFQTDAYLDRSSHFYRPMQTLSYMVDLQLAGKSSTWMFHLTNILLLGLIACALFLLLRKFRISSKLALLGTLVYCVHPLFVTSVAWLPSRGDLQLMLFSLLAFLFYIEYLQQRKPKYLFLHWSAFVVALFCKETAAVLPLLFMLYFLTFTSGKLLDKRLLLNIGFYVIAGIGWFYLRSMVIGDFASQNQVMGMIGRNDEVGLTPILSNLRTLPESLAMFLIPYDIAPLPGFSSFKTFTGLMLIVLFGALFFMNKRMAKKEMFFCLSWFVILLLPTLIYKSDLIDYLNHRFFLPLVGVILLMLMSIPEKWIKNGNLKNAWIIWIVIIGLSAATFVETLSYSNPITFYSSSIDQNPKCALAYNNRGVIYEHQGADLNAINDYSKAIELKPDYDDAWYNRGALFSRQGLLENAIHDYSKAIASDSGYNEAYINRGNIYSQQGMLEKAIVDYSKAIALKPGYALIYNNRAVVYGKQGQLEKQIEDFSKAIELKPDYTEAYTNRGMTYANQKLFDKALADFTKVVDLKPEDAESYLNRGIVFHAQGALDKAHSDFQRAADLGSDEGKKMLETISAKKR
jgi:tetratricopeptide (TPR) repeat protein